MIYIIIENHCINGYVAPMSILYITLTHPPHILLTKELLFFVKKPKISEVLPVIEKAFRIDMTQYNLYSNNLILELTDRVDDESILLIKPKFDETKWEKVPDKVKIRYKMNSETNIIIFPLSPKFITLQQLIEKIENQLEFLNLNNKYNIEVLLSSDFGSKNWIPIESIDLTLKLYKLFNKDKYISTRLTIRRNQKNIDICNVSTKSKYLVQCNGSKDFNFINVIKKRFMKPDIACHTKRNKNGMTDENIYKALNRVKLFATAPKEYTLFLVDNVKDYITIELSSQTIKKIIEPLFLEDTGIFIVPLNSPNHLSLIVIIKIKNHVVLHHLDASSSRTSGRMIMNNVEQAVLKCSFSNDLTIKESLTIINYQLYDTLSNENKFAGGNCSVFAITNVLHFLNNIDNIDGSFDNFIQLFIEVLKLTTSRKKMIHLINSFVNNLFVDNESDFDDSLLYLLLDDIIDGLTSAESFEQLYNVIMYMVSTKMKENNYMSDCIFLTLFLKCGAALDNVKKLGTIIADEIFVKHLSIDF